MSVLGIDLLMLWRRRYVIGQTIFVDGVPSEYLEASRKSLNDEQQFRAFEAAVRSLYKQMARISIAPEWAKVLDFETRLPSAVEQLMSPDDSAGS